MYYPTPILKSLVATRHLERTVSYLFFSGRHEILTFLWEVFREKGYDLTGQIEKEIPLLKTFGLISDHQYSETRYKSSLNFIEAINFELTYQCNYRCVHCLQNGLEKNDTEGMLSGKQILENVKIAKVLGLIKAGVNITGGEVLGQRDDLFDILEGIREMGISFRLNTNSWWARKTDMTIAGKFFKNGTDLIRYIKSLGCARIAFSFDGRYKNKLSLAPDFVESVRICEKTGMSFEIIFTGIEESIVMTVYYELLKTLGKRRLNHIGKITVEEMVDVGGAADSTSEMFDKQENIAPCNGRGFYRPVFLHFDPYGRVRTCLYGVGLANVGDLRTDTLPVILNNFVANPDSEFFSSSDVFEENFKNIIGPYLHFYKPVRHQCTRMVIFARYLEMIKAGYKEPDIHRTIAREMNLTST
jgi:MoaA/NifB/PqqE/SkfB family radical SAM enzyme